MRSVLEESRSGSPPSGQLGEQHAGLVTNGNRLQTVAQLRAERSRAPGSRSLTLERSTNERSAVHPEEDQAGSSAAESQVRVHPLLPGPSRPAMSSPGLICSPTGRRAETRSREAEHQDNLLRGLLFPMRESGSEVTDSLNAPRSKVTPRRSPKEVSPPSDFELMSSMMQKLTHLEKKVMSQALDIDRKTRRIAVLEEKLQRLQEKAQREKQDEEDVNLKCHRLQKQVLEMEKFLNDYGMIWVGDCEDKDEDTKQTSHQPGPSMVSNFCVNFDLVLQNIRDLNFLAGEGGTRITFVPGGAKLTPQPAGDLQLYRNGMVMFHGPFRPYTEPQTQRFLQDLMDGFFPSELQDRFPHGLVFQVEDRREEEFRAEFPGKGHTVGHCYREETSDTPPRLSHSRAPEGKLSMQQFLNKLPERVVKGGNVINIRSSLKHHLQGCDSPQRCAPSVIETPALHTLRGRPECDEVSEICNLRVKSEDGEKMFILKMFYSETIGHFRRYLDAHRDPGGRPYDIISAFPHQCYHSDNNQTLLQCGLTPSAALLLRPRPPVTT